MTSWDKHLQWGPRLHGWMYELRVLDTSFLLDYELEVKMDQSQAKRDHMFQIVKRCFDLRPFQIRPEVSWS